jgi:replicative DNA helicase
VTLPHDLAAEQALLGAALLASETVAHAGALAGAHFYDPVHADLWDEIALRYRDGRLSDVLALKEWFSRRAPELGAVYLMKLMDAAAPLSVQAAGYADLLRDLARRRAVIGAANEAIKAASEGGADALTGLEAKLQEIAADHADADDWERLGVIACESVERAELGEAVGISTGLPKLDAMTGGMQPGTLWVIGGATSMGKSVFGAFLGRSIGAQGYGVAEAHLEMRKLQIGLRTSAALAFDINHRSDNPFYLTAQRNALRPEQWDKLRGAARASATLPVYVDARPGRTLSQIEAAARRLYRKMRREGVPPGALIIDHEGLIAAEPGARFPSQLERTNARSEAMLAMAKRLGVCVVALSQITKEGSRADGDDRLPNLTDLNYGGAISQAAEVVILLHRKAYYAERKPPHLRSDSDWDALKSREALAIVDKARAGQRAQVPFLMDMPTAAVWPA